jgi:transmembrane sensor
MSRLPMDFEDFEQGPPSEAAAWFARKRSGEMTAREAGELDAWLGHSPENQAAFDELEHYWRVAAAGRADPDMMAVREETLRSLRRRPDRRWLAGSIAAALMVAVLGGWAASQTGLLADLGLVAEPSMQAFSTAVGQRATIKLADGSVVTLDTDTLIRTRDTGRKRLVMLEKGRAFFHVAKDTNRPFIVAAGGRTVTATGTAFDVRVDAGRMEVTLVEGRVQVLEDKGRQGGRQKADMLPGWRLVAGDGDAWLLAEVDAGRATSWMNGQLTFSNTPMSEVVAEMNRYSARKILIRDPALGRAPVIGAFKAGDVDAFVAAVKTYRLARVVRSSDTVVELAAP